MAKVTKFKDRENNILLPVTRATLVEMDNGSSVQEAYDVINATLAHKEGDALLVRFIDDNLSKPEWRNANGMWNIGYGDDLALSGFVQELMSIGWNNRYVRVLYRGQWMDLSTSTLVADDTSSFGYNGRLTFCGLTEGGMRVLTLTVGKKQAVWTYNYKVFTFS